VILFNLAFKEIGIEIGFEGKGSDEMGRIIAIDRALFENITLTECNMHIGNVCIKVDPFYYRPPKLICCWGFNQSKRKIGVGPQT
jgi:GDP-D-mannose dehydratase